MQLGKAHHRYKHGAAPKGKRGPLYIAWAGMLGRCRNRNNPKWENYGGRGIRVCERWYSFELFAQDVGPHPGKGWSLDRYPDNGGDYEPTNWRWATPALQSRNRRSTRLTEEKVVDIRRRYVRGIFGQRGTGNRRALAKEYGVSRSTISMIAAGENWSVQK